MKSRRREAVQDSEVIGWISISEVFLLCGVTMLTIALAVESNLDQTRHELNRTQGRLHHVVGGDQFGVDGA